MSRDTAEKKLEKSEKRERSQVIDNHVGGKLRQLRRMRGFTLKDFAEHIGVSFQQVQKYESGTNRISAGKLYELSKILGVSVASFYEGVDNVLSSAGQPDTSGQPDIGQYIMSTREVQDLVKSFYNISSDKLRRKVLALVRAASS